MKLKDNSSPPTEYVRWAYRLFLDREPENEAVLGRPFGSTAELREGFLGSIEFRSRNPHWASADQWVIKETKFGFRIFINLSDVAISRQILLDSYDPVETQFILRTVQAGDRVLDIGANLGYYTLLMAHRVGPQGHVFGFEPLEHLHRYLQRSCAENGFQSICEIHRAALSENSGEAKVRHAPMTTNLGGGFLVEPSMVPADHVDEVVKTVRLDDLAHIGAIKFIKMDVEGAEPRVIEGGRRLVETCRPIILSELHNPQLRRVSGIDATAFIGRLRAIGYGCHVLEASGLGGTIECYEADQPINVIFKFMN